MGGYSSTFGREDDKIPHPSSRFFYHPDSGWSRDQRQAGSLFQRLREAEKRDPGNEVAKIGGDSIRRTASFPGSFLYFEKVLLLSRSRERTLGTRLFGGMVECWNGMVEHTEYSKIRNILKHGKYSIF